MSLGTDNPFSRVYDAVWNSLFAGANNPLAALIKPGNRVNYDVNQINPMKPTMASADAPELILIDEGGQCNLHANSSGTSYVMYLSIYCASGTWVYGLVSTVNWYIMCNVPLLQTSLNKVKWNGDTPVKKIDIIPIQTILNNPIVPKAINGFTLVWRMQIELRIQNVDLTYTEQRT